MIKILISFGANIMAKDLTNNSVLYYAIQQNQIEIIRVIYINNVLDIFISLMSIWCSISIIC